MSEDSLFRTSGAVALPVTTTESTLASLDPTRDILAGLLTAALNDELGVAWAAAAAGTTLAGTLPVQDTYPDVLTDDVLKARDTRFPLLAVYRSPEPQRIEEYTTETGHWISKWGVEYVLGTLNVGERRKLKDALTFAARVMYLTMEQGGHRAYVSQTTESGIEQAKNVLGPGVGCANLFELKIESLIVGMASFAESGPEYHALRMTLESREVDGINGFPDSWEWTETAFTIGAGTREGIIPEFLRAEVKTP